MPFDELDEFLGEYRDAADLPDRVRTTSERIFAESTPRQRELILDKHRKIALRSPRRVGKTGGILRKFLFQATKMYHGSFRYAALSRPHAEELLWQPLKDLVEKYKIRGRFYEADLTFDFHDTGSQIKLVGADDKKESDKLRGGAHDGIAVDEAAAFPSRLLRYYLTQVIRYTLIDRRGWLLLGGTPGSVFTGEFYEATKVGADRSRPYQLRDTADWARYVCKCPSPCVDFEWSLHKWRASDSPLEHLEEELEAIRLERGWSKENPIYLRESCGEWAVDDSGRVYKYRREKDGQPWNTWEPCYCTSAYLSTASPDGKCVWRGGMGCQTERSMAEGVYTYFGLPRGHHWQFVAGCDLGNRKIQQEERERNPDRQVPNKTAIELLAFSETCRDLYHAYEIVRPFEGVTELAGAIKFLQSKVGAPFEMFVDLAGAGGMILDELASVHGIACDPAEKKNKPDAIELLNGDMVDGHFKVLGESQLEAEMNVLQWSEDGLHENKSQANDCCDCACYARRGATHVYVSELAKKPEPKKGDPDPEPGQARGKTPESQDPYAETSWEESDPWEKEADFLYKD